MSGPLVLLTASELASLMREAVFAALQEFEAGKAPAPELVKGPAMCALINVSRSMLHRLRLDGMPAVPVGDTFRYQPQAVIAWLAERNGAK